MAYIPVVLYVSQRTYDEIVKKLKDANCHQAFYQDDSSLNGMMINMYGIALAMADEPTPPTEEE